MISSQTIHIYDLDSLNCIFDIDDRDPNFQGHHETYKLLK